MDENTKQHKRHHVNTKTNISLNKA